MPLSRATGSTACLNQATKPGAQNNASGCTAAAAIFNKYCKAYEDSEYLPDISHRVIRTGAAGSKGRCFKGTTAKQTREVGLELTTSSDQRTRHSESFRPRAWGTNTRSLMCAQGDTFFPTERSRSLVRAFFVMRSLDWLGRKGKRRRQSSHPILQRRLFFVSSAEH